MVASLDKAIRDKEWIVVTGTTKWSQMTWNICLSKELVQLFLEEDLKQINLRLLLFQTNLEEGHDLMTIIKEGRRSRSKKNGMKPIDSLDEVIWSLKL
jgi:hypothetical protein